MANPINRSDDSGPQQVADPKRVADLQRVAGLQRGIRQLLEGFEMAGAQTVPRAAVRLPADSVLATQPAKTKMETREPVADISTKSVNEDRSTLPNSVSPSLPLAERQAALLSLADEVSQCASCTELASTRTKTVFGVGSPAARLCLLGEAPGANEDRQGEPFVGRAGQLLDKILAACTLSRQDVYILNVIKCRPPGNRNPASEEVSHCRPFFERQIDIIQPEFICCLGSVAAQNLLETNQPIGRLRGEFHSWRGIKVLATYHPAYLLRNPAAKAEVWKDMQMLMHEMGIELPRRKPT